MSLRRLALAVAPLVGLALAESSSGQVPDFPVDGDCAGSTDVDCALSLRKLRGKVKAPQDGVEPAKLAQQETPAPAEPAEPAEPVQPVAAAGSASCFVMAPEDVKPPFSDEEVATVRALFLKNVDVDHSGAVVAAPDRNTPGGNYYYHWERDGALAMHALLSTSGLTEEVDGIFKDYVKWVKKAQEQPATHSGTDIRVEPKYEIPSAKPMEGGWCRPQTDGPGLRAMAMAEYAMAILGKAGGRDFVMENLWASDSSLLTKRLISYDLDWVVHHWREDGCDLWEEIQSSDFFWGRYTMRRGLYTGAKLARMLGDEPAYNSYVGQIQEIDKDLLQRHWTGKFINQCGDGACADRMLDAAVIEAINVGHEGDDFIPLLGKEVLGTVIALNGLFCNLYNVNRVDSQKGVPGILWGRYEKDHYAGGNPWVLLTASLARIIYRQSAAAAHAPVSEEVHDLLNKAYGIPSGLSGAALASALVRTGDGVLLRLKGHLPPSLHMSEQLDRNTGASLGAKDLTWNYANVLLAMQARHEAVGASTATF